VGPEASDFSNQVHDFNPGFGNGLFWTIPVPAGSVQVSPGRGAASMEINNLALNDYFTIPNALLGISPPNPATVSFHIDWAPSTSHFKVRDQATGVAGEFVQNTATMSWSAASAGNSYLSGPQNTSFSVSSQVGYERNGVFFPQGG
jgi:hypothetical protein